eukprot:scaffold213217_cov27-Tisochrysis_lutea.AAC.1
MAEMRLEGRRERSGSMKTSTTLRRSSAYVASVCRNSLTHSRSSTAAAFCALRSACLASSCAPIISAICVSGRMSRLAVSLEDWCERLEVRPLFDARGEENLLVLCRGEVQLSPGTRGVPPPPSSVEFAEVGVLCAEALSRWLLST